MVAQMVTNKGSFKAKPVKGPAKNLNILNNTTVKKLKTLLNIFDLI
jgi:hypothetical protein